MSPQTQQIACHKNHVTADHVKLRKGLALHPEKEISSGVMADFPSL